MLVDTSQSRTDLAPGEPKGILAPQHFKTTSLGERLGDAGWMQQLNCRSRKIPAQNLRGSIRSPLCSRHWIFYKNLTSWWTKEKEQGGQEEEIPLCIIVQRIQVMLAKRKTYYIARSDVLSEGPRKASQEIQILPCVDFP
ncbi:hypothetical protein AVEN_192555-1 [Araneus ventricosus]|uniref:Uncharacterized protein n=1 Tax=Araneus ventricosus TaxID=182803 RepID=A0A4Y2FVW4_ARAVE|nr:hypothetical protein AVEN_192555-1 [Araneus ventricosus]